MFPSGILTFLFTDIEGSTQLWERFPDAMRSALAAHDAALKQAIETGHGEVVKTTGDGVMAAFASATDGIAAALAAQRTLKSQEPSSEDTPRIRVRMALHSGEAQARDGDYFGSTLNRAARLMAIGHGGQVLLSAATYALVRESLPDGATLRDMGEHRLKDLTQPERVYQLCAADLPRDFPALKSLDAHRHNLPVQLTSFVGREAELAEVARLLDGTRLLTLIGPGGTGKTRLSLQAAAELVEQYPDGVWLVEFAPLTDGVQVEQAIAGALEVREQPGVSLERALADFVRYKQLLLLLDNCEHLIGAVAQTVQRLLQAGPQIKIIASSREGLAIAGETIMQVPSLGLPPDGETSPDVLMQYESVRLFIERARAALPSFALTPDNAESVCEICRRVDGIPLAIELAAVRIRMLTPAQIAARLREHFRLLTGGSRTALPRQQTLQALIDWSWNLLGEDERAVLRRLSVFVEGWTLEAAEAVCSEPPAVNGEQSAVDGEQSTVNSKRSTVVAASPVTVNGSLFTDDVLNLLGQLVNKSLVIAQPIGDETRYRLLETVRQYARDKLLAAAESELVHERHARYFVQLASLYSAHMYALDMGIWAARFDADAENFAAAYNWLADSNPLGALQFANLISFGFQRASRLAECERRMDDAINRVRRLPPPETRERRAALAFGLAVQCSTCLALGEIRKGREFGREGEALAREIDDRDVLAFVLTNLAICDVTSGELALGEAEAREAHEFAQAPGATGLWLGPGAVMAALSVQAFATALRGDGDRALAMAREATDRARASGSPWANALAQMNAARVASLSGEFPLARMWVEQSIAEFRRAGDLGFSRSMEAELGHILRREGRRAEARAVYRGSIRWLYEMGNQGGIAHQLECFAMLALDDGDPERAARLFGAASKLRDESQAAMWMHERPDYEAAQERLRATLDPAAVERMWNEGARLGVKQAIELALEEPRG